MQAEGDDNFHSSREFWKGVVVSASKYHALGGASLFSVHYCFDVDPPVPEDAKDPIRRSVWRRWSDVQRLHAELCQLDAEPLPPISGGTGGRPDDVRMLRMRLAVLRRFARALPHLCVNAIDRAGSENAVSRAINRFLGSPERAVTMQHAAPDESTWQSHTERHSVIIGSFPKELPLDGACLTVHDVRLCPNKVLDCDFSVDGKRWSQLHSIEQDGALRIEGRDCGVELFAITLDPSSCAWHRVSFGVYRVAGLDSARKHPRCANYPESVSIDGSTTEFKHGDAHTAYKVCTVWANGTKTAVLKRYSDFRSLRERLRCSEPFPKRSILPMRSSVVGGRRRELSSWLAGAVSRNRSSEDLLMFLTPLQE
eukprot:TRINITY_DN3932_c0_g1_i1.p1 TRINITY_DN3932_c0_g1~~TRINITY_DN3932_c0_g1_i1.p1  ORF type:complete len:368 (+),score=76.23 TRINITY_DN3932_c0_g1_i1:64-1167(+)